MTVAAASAEPGSEGPVELCAIADMPGIGLVLRGDRGIAGGRISCGRVRSISSIKNLPNGVWMSNIPWDEPLLRSERDPAAMIHSCSWLQIPWNDLLLEWGIDPGKQLQMADSLVRVVARVTDIVLKSSAAMGHDCRAGLKCGSRILEQTSLSRGFRRELEARLSLTYPRERQLCAPVGNLHLAGVRSWTRKQERGFRMAIAKIPTFSHFKRIASRPVPSPGAWHSCSLPARRDPIADSRALAELRSLGRPVICEGVFRPGANRAPSWAAAWASGSDPSVGRRHFALEEIGIMSRYGEFALHAAYAGPGWTEGGRSAAGEARDALASVCGGGEIAGSTWSAGVAAEIILCAAMSRFPYTADCPSLESAWISIADRIEMIPALEASERSGAELVSACAGRLRLRVPASRDSMPEVANSLWRSAAVMPGEKVAADADFPDAREGGELYARCQVASSKKAMWLLDSVLDASPESRGGRFNAAKRAAIPMTGQ
ncbi:MAG: hypothetical protein OXC26_08080 [Albidovulum sp.]|nr:hypothetical protein [Albidovulum sp.]